MFFSPPGNNIKNHQRDAKKTYSKKKNTEVVHFYSPLPKYIATITNIKNIIIPTITDTVEILSGAANLPITIVIKVTWAKFENIFSKISFCFLFNFIIILYHK